MYILILILSIISLLLASIPSIISTILKKFLGCSVASMIMSSPIKITQVLIHIKPQNWGLQHIVIHIPKIWLNFSLKGWKVIIKAENAQVFIGRRCISLSSVKILDGAQQANILLNLYKQIIDKYNINLRKSFQTPKYTGHKIEEQPNKLTIIINAFVYFLTVIFLQFIEIQFNQVDFSIVSQIPESLISFKSKRQTHQTLQLMQYLSQYTISMQLVSLKISIKHRKEEQFYLECNNIKIRTYQHIEENLSQIKNVRFYAILPFTFSLQQSLKKLIFIIKFNEVAITTIPSDFASLSLLFHQLFFEPKDPPMKSHSQKESNIQVNLYVDTIKITLKSLFEPQYDHSDTFEYLSNIQYSTLSFQNLSLLKNEFTIEQVTLSVKKSLLGSNIFPQDDIVLIIPNVMIVSTDKKIDIKHGQVAINCQRQQLALLGKLFLLINSRIRCEEYNWKFYKQYVDICQQYIQGNIGLVELISQSLNIDSQPIQEQKQLSKSQKQVSYTPQTLTLKLNINKLTHKILLPYPKYIQQQNYNIRIHTLQFEKVLIQYKSIKQFTINNFKLIFQQSSKHQQISIFIQEILMIQNYYTLMEYLIGFTMFKRLLQVGDDMDTGQPKATGKSGKKIVSITKIVLNYLTQTIVVRKLIVDKQSALNGYLTYLYFSLGKSDVILNQISQQSKILAYPLPQSHTLFTFQTLTLKTTLNQSSQSTYLKQRSQIHLKSPIFILPESNIAKRVLEYIQTFEKLSVYIEAYLKNVTDDKLKIILKNRLLNIIQQPNIFVFRITDICIGMDDTIFNVAMLNYSRFIRQYLSKNHIYNHNQILSQLNQTKKIFKLCTININNITLDYQPISKITNNIDSIEKYLIDIFNQNIGQIRINKIKTFKIKILLKDFNLRIRDYPLNIAKINSLSMQADFLKLRNVYHQSRYFLKGRADIGKIQVNIGLNLLSGIEEIYRKIISYLNVIQSRKNTQQWLHKFGTSKNLTKINDPQQYQPYWHILHKQSIWNIQIQKIPDTAINILTDSTPYSLQMLQTKIGQVKIRSSLLGTKFVVEGLKLFHKQWDILQLGELGGIIRTIYNQPLIKIIIQCNIGTYENRKNILILSKNLRDYLSKMKQLKTDWLLIYGLIELSDQDEDDQPAQKRFSYFQIANMAANRRIRQSNQQLSLMSVLSSLQAKFYLEMLEVYIKDEGNIVHGVFDQLKIRTKAVVKRGISQWKLDYFRSSLRNIIGRTINNKKQNNKDQFLTNLSLLTKRQRLNQQINPNDYPGLEQIFLMAKNIQFILNAYHIQHEKIYLCKRLFSCESLKGEISLNLKKILQKLFWSMIVDGDLGNTVSKGVKKAQKKSQRFRKAVKYIIRLNRKKRKNAPTLETVLKINSISLSLKTDKRQLILGSNEQSILKINSLFSKEDKYHIDPLWDILLSFKNLRMLIQAIKPQWIYLNTQKQLGLTILTAKLCNFEIKIYKNHQMPIYIRNDNKIFLNKEQRLNETICLFQDGLIQLTMETSNSLREIVEFIVMMVDRKQRREKIKRLQTQKYSQLTTQTRPHIQKQLEWHYSDLKKQQKRDARHSFILSNMSIILFKNPKKDMLIQMQSNQIKINVQTFTNGKVQRRLEIDRLILINCLEKENTPYREMLEMKGTQQIAIIIDTHDYQLFAFNQKILWNFYPLIRIHINPLRIKITKQIYDNLYEFFFGLEKQFNQKVNQENNNDNQFKYASQIPNYIKKLTIEAIKVQVWYRTDSMIKRMEGITVGLEKFQQNDWFVTKKQLFDSWLKFVLKQLASQIFNVLGQKIFG